MHKAEIVNVCIEMKSRMHKKRYGSKWSVFLKFYANGRQSMRYWYIIKNFSFYFSILTISIFQNYFSISFKFSGWSYNMLTHEKTHISQIFLENDWEVFDFAVDRYKLAFSKYLLHILR